MFVLDASGYLTPQYRFSDGCVLLRMQKLETLRSSHWPSDACSCTQLSPQAWTFLHRLFELHADADSGILVSLPWQIREMKRFMARRCKLSAHENVYVHSSPSLSLAVYACYICTVNSRPLTDCASTHMLACMDTEPSQ